VQTPSYGPGAPPGATLPAAAAPAAVLCTEFPRPRGKASEEQAVANRAYGAELGIAASKDAADGYRTMTVSRAIAGFKKNGQKRRHHHRLLRVFGSSRWIGRCQRDNAGERSSSHRTSCRGAGQALLTDWPHCQGHDLGTQGLHKAMLGEQRGRGCLVTERVKKGTYEAEHADHPLDPRRPSSERSG